MIYTFALTNGDCITIKQRTPVLPWTKCTPTAPEGLDPAALVLPLVCRHLYCETALFPFEQNVLCFASLPAFLDIKRRFTPDQRSAMSHVQVCIRLCEMDLTVIARHKNAPPLSETLPNVQSVQLKTRVHESWRDVGRPRFDKTMLVLKNYKWLEHWPAVMGKDEVEFEIKHTAVIACERAELCSELSDC
jgi:hypothetical protein